MDVNYHRSLVWKKIEEQTLPKEKEKMLELYGLLDDIKWHTLAKPVFDIARIIFFLLSICFFDSSLIGPFVAFCITAHILSIATKKHRSQRLKYVVRLLEDDPETIENIHHIVMAFDPDLKYTSERVIRAWRHEATA